MSEENEMLEELKKIRELLRDGKVPPEDMMRKEVAETILKYDHPFVEE